jgi:hypothetical protein
MRCSDDERRRLRDGARGRVVHLGAHRRRRRRRCSIGMTEALGLDTRRVTVSFDNDSPDDRQRMARACTGWGAW